MRPVPLTVRLNISRRRSQNGREVWRCVCVCVFSRPQPRGGPAGDRQYGWRLQVARSVVECRQASVHALVPPIGPGIPTNNRPIHRADYRGTSDSSLIPFKHTGAVIHIFTINSPRYAAVLLSYLIRAINSGGAKMISSLFLIVANY